MKAVSLALAAAVAMGSAGVGLAQEMKAQQRSSGTVLGFDVQGTYSNLTLSISGPRGFSARTFAEKGNPRLNLGRGLPDGVYNYELTAATDEPADLLPSGLDNGRDEGAAKTVPRQGAATRGTFVVRNGSIVPPQELAEAKED